MNFIRAVLFGALLWVLIFFEVSVLMFGFRLTGALYYVVHYILAVLLVGIITTLYFRNRQAHFWKGMQAGVIFAVTGILLDLLLTVPLFVKDYGLMFGDMGLWVGVLLGILSAGTVGAIKK